jgi:transcriptional regulator with XRE-family HTH domain
VTVGESPAVARHRLRLALRRARLAKGLTQRQVAEALDWSLSKVNRMEAGEVTVSSTDLQALLRHFDVTDRDRVEQLIEEARAARRRGWWDQPEYREHLTSAMIQSVQFETEATAIRSFQPTVIPGVLQTRAYASAVVSIWGGELSEADRDSRLEVRARRREQLFSRPDPPEYLLVLDESVLLREVGGPRTMSEQLYDLLDLARAGRVNVRVVPLAHSALYAVGLFVIYAKDDEDVALYRESNLADEVLYSAETIGRHRELFERIWDQASSVEGSSHMIEARAATLRSAADRLRPDG